MCYKNSCHSHLVIWHLKSFLMQIYPKMHGSEPRVCIGQFLPLPGRISDENWQTSPAGCCARPMLRQRLSTPSPAGLRSAWSAGRRNDPTPAAGCPLTLCGWCSRTHSARREENKRGLVDKVGIRWEENTSETGGELRAEDSKMVSICSMTPLKAESLVTTLLSSQ